MTPASRRRRAPALAPKPTETRVLALIKDYGGRCSWSDVLCHFHPESHAEGGGHHTPREVVARCAPTLATVVPDTWPAEDSLNALLDRGTLHEPTLGTVEAAP